MKLTRRAFVSRTTAAGLAIGAPAVLKAATGNRKYRTALIGSGW